MPKGSCSVICVRCSMGMGRSCFEKQVVLLLRQRAITGSKLKKREKKKKDLYVSKW